MWGKYVNNIYIYIYIGTEKSVEYHIYIYIDIKKNCK